MFEGQMKITKMGTPRLQSDLVILFALLFVLVSFVTPAPPEGTNSPTTMNVSSSTGAQQDKSSTLFQSTQPTTALELSTIMSTKTVTTQQLSTTTTLTTTTTATAITTRQSPTTREQSAGPTGPLSSSTSESVSFHGSSQGRVTQVTIDYTTAESTTDAEHVSSTSPGQSSDDTFNIFKIFEGHDTVTVVAVPVVLSLLGAFCITAVACWVKKCRRGSNRRERFKLLRSEERSGGNLLDGSSEDEF